MQSQTNCFGGEGKGKLKNSALRDLWFHVLLDLLLIVSIGVGIWQLIAGAPVISPLLISVLWAVHSAIPPTLLLYYALLGRGLFFQFLCKCAALSPQCCLLQQGQCLTATQWLMQTAHHHSAQNVLSARHV